MLATGIVLGRTLKGPDGLAVGCFVPPPIPTTNTTWGGRPVGPGSARRPAGVHRHSQGHGRMAVGGLQTELTASATMQQHCLNIWLVPHIVFAHWVFDGAARQI